MLHVLYILYRYIMSRVSVISCIYTPVVLYMYMYLLLYHVYVHLSIVDICDFINTVNLLSNIYYIVFIDSVTIR